MKIIKLSMVTIALSFSMIGCGSSTPSESTTQTSELQNSSYTANLTTSSVADQLTADENGKVTTINASGDVTSVVASKEALFFASGENGVEIISIGYSDKISTELLFKITDINAKQVTLSDDEMTLYVEDEIGFIQKYDISNLTNPTHQGRTTKQAIDNSALSKDGTFKYIPRDEKGLEVINMSNPSNIYTESTFTISNAFDVVLVDNDTKALIATGPVGINLLDLTNPKYLDNIANYRIPGASITGITLNATKDILFVATGDKGVLVFNVDILLHKLGY